MEYDRSLFTCHRPKQWLLSKSFRTDWLAIKYRNEPSGVKSHQENFPRASGLRQSYSSFLGQSNSTIRELPTPGERSVACSLGRKLRQPLSIIFDYVHSRFSNPYPAVTFLSFSFFIVFYRGSLNYSKKFRYDSILIFTAISMISEYCWFCEEFGESFLDKTYSNIKVHFC